MWCYHSPCVSDVGASICAWQAKFVVSFIVLWYFFFSFFFDSTLYDVFGQSINVYKLTLFLNIRQLFIIVARNLTKWDKDRMFNIKKRETENWTSIDQVCLCFENSMRKSAIGLFAHTRKLMRIKLVTIKLRPFRCLYITAGQNYKNVFNTFNKYSKLYINRNASNKFCSLRQCSLCSFVNAIELWLVHDFH